MKPTHLGVPVALALVTACQGGRPDTATGDGGGNIVTGQVFKGPVALATVTAYRLDPHFQRGAQLAEATTDAQGAWSMSLPAYAGHILFAASNGSYVEEAVGVAVKLDGSELLAVVHDYLPSQGSLHVTISPVSHWAQALASYWTLHSGEALGAAMDEAYQHLGADLGGLDWTSVVPTDFNSVDGGVQMGDADRAGLLLAALSQETLEMATRAGVTPAVGLSSLDLVNALADDVSQDGYFDGVGTTGRLHLPVSVNVVPPPTPSATALDGQTLRGALALALRDYLSNPLNSSHLAFTDVRPLLDALAADNDTRIFRTDGGVFDVDPPVLTFNPAPPLYTNQSSYTVQVVANDVGSGVAAVYATMGATQIQGVLQSGDGGATSGCVAQFQQDSGVSVDGGATDAGDAGACIPGALYALTLNFPTQQHYAVQVWAIDKAGNSSESTSSALNFAITYDATPPAISIDTTTGVYADEANVQLMVNLPDGGIGAGPWGAPLLPPAYASLGTKVSPWPAAGTVNKVATRLSWGASQPTAAQLWAQNPSTMNVPFLVYQVAYNAQTDAPVTGATYSITCSVNCPAGASTTTGNLIADPSIQAPATFLLPLTLETLPDLSQTPVGGGSVDFLVSIFANDAAGNAGTRLPSTVHFNVLGPPVAIQEDATYPASSDVHGTYAYRIANGHYDPMWTSNTLWNSNFLPNDTVRLVRYIVSNPEPMPVALSVGILAGSSAQAVEEWDEDARSINPSLTTSADGVMTGGDFSSVFYFLQGFGACSPSYPCAQGTFNFSSTSAFWHPNGLTTNTGGTGPYEVQCSNNATAPTTHANAPKVETSLSINAELYSSPQQGGGELNIDAWTSNEPGYAVIPAATNSQAGQVALYLTRAHVASRSDSLTWQSLNPQSGLLPRYEQYVQDWWGLFSVVYLNPPCAPNPQFPTPGWEYLGLRDLQYLSAANTVMSGSFSLLTFGITPATTSAFGHTRPVGSGLSFSRTIPQ